MPCLLLSLGHLTKEKTVRYTESTCYVTELERMSAILTLLNLRDSTKQGYMQTLFEVCRYLEEKYHISIDDADYLQLRDFLAWLHKPVSEGGRGLKPRTVNVYNCSIKKYFQLVLMKPLSNDQLPTMKIDYELPKVPSREEVYKLITSTKDIRNRLIFALGFGCALRLNEVLTLRFEDISLKGLQVTIRAENSKNRREGRVELPVKLVPLLKDYYYQRRYKAQPNEYLFPGRNPGSHLTDGTVQRHFKEQLEKLGWADRGYHFHSLRHAHALFYYQDGADLFQVQQRLRHNCIASTMVYVQLDTELQKKQSVINPFDRQDFRF